MRPPRALSANTMKTSDVIVWVYVVLLTAGGLFGYFKAGSKVSLIMALAFAVLLGLCTLGLPKVQWLTEILLVALLVVFAMRLFKTGKFMPSGMMLSVTALALLLRFWFR